MQLKTSSWNPPKSPIGMLQEDMWPDPWRILVVCMLHNQTSRKQVNKVYQQLFCNYDSPEAMTNANPDFLAKILKPLGLYNRRSKALIRFSREYLSSEWEMPSDLYGCGKYADDCYKVFCLGMWKDVSPTDHALNDYVEWLQKKEASNA